MPRSCHKHNKPVVVMNIAGVLASLLESFEKVLKDRK